MLAMVGSGLLVLGAFYLLSIISEEFFVPAIDRLAKKLRLSSDAAGATLLAIGSSAPELFTSIFAVFGTQTGGGDIGAGTIVGSAIFNVLVIVGAASMFRVVKLQWQPVLRDMGFYILTILILFWAFSDGRISLLESGLFVLLYFIYIVAAIYWRKIFNYQDVDAVELVADNPVNNLGGLVRKILGVVIPNPVRRPKLYGLTFVLSILAIAGLSHQLVHHVVVIADYFSINPTFLALTVLAAGTSMPDLIGSVIVAKQGRGDMAVSNALGSNIFDVLVGLGAPWLVYIAWKGGEINVGTENLFASIFLLFATVVALLFLMLIKNWKIGHKSGLFLIALYGGYLIYILKSL